MTDKLSTITVLLSNESQTDVLGTMIARFLQKWRDKVLQEGFNFRLSGDLGVGKTSITRAILRALGFNGRVKSPTFTLLESYFVLDLSFHHFDFYRFEEPSEFDEAGFREMFGPGRITACEWSQKAEPYLPAEDILLSMIIDGDGRKVTIQAKTVLGELAVKELNTWNQ